MQSTKRPVSFFFTSIQPSSHGRCKKFSLLVPKYSYFQAAEKLLIKMHRQALRCWLVVVTLGHRGVERGNAVGTGNLV